MSLSFAVLRLRNFRLLILTRMFGVMALQCQAVIVGWQVYSLTKDPFMLGLTGLTEAIPAICAAFFAGHVVDSIQNPKTVYRLCYLALTLNTLMLYLFAGGIIPVGHTTLLAIIFSGIFISGIARSCIMPSSFAMLPLIVAKKDLPAASAWQSSVFQIGAIGGPAIAGLIYGGYGPHGAWTIPTSLMFLSFVLLHFINLPSIERIIAKRESTFKSIKAGWSFILGNPVLLSVMTLDMFAVLFGGAVAMLPAYADQVLHVGSEGLGMMRAAPAIGAIGMALYFAVKPMQKVSAKHLLWVVAGFGVSIIGFGLSKVFWLSTLCLALSGCFDSISVVIRLTLMQLLTPDAMRGRVSSVNSMFVISSNEIGAFESGTAARFLGLVPSVVLGGCMTLLVVAVTAILSPRMRRTVVNAEDGKVTS